MFSQGAKGIVSGQSEFEQSPYMMKAVRIRDDRPGDGIVEITDGRPIRSPALCTSPISLNTELV